MEYEVVDPKSPIRRGQRTEYTPRDDYNLVKFLVRNPEMGRTGNAVYIQMEKRYPRHSWQSYRERYKKNERRLTRDLEKYEKLVQSRRDELEDPFSTSEDERPRSLPTNRSARNHNAAQPANVQPAVSTSNIPQKSSAAAAPPRPPRFKELEFGTSSQVARKRLSAPTSTHDDQITDGLEAPVDAEPTNNARAASTMPLSKATQVPAAFQEPAGAFTVNIKRKRKRMTDFLDTSPEPEEGRREKDASITENQQRVPVERRSYNATQAAMLSATASTSGAPRPMVTTSRSAEPSIASTFDQRTTIGIPNATTSAPDTAPQKTNKRLSSKPLPAQLFADDWDSEQLDTLLTAQQLDDLTFVCSNSRKIAVELAGLLLRQQTSGEPLTRPEKERLRHLSGYMWTVADDECVLSRVPYASCDVSFRKWHTANDAVSRHAFLSAHTTSRTLKRKRFPFDV